MVGEDAQRIGSDTQLPHEPQEVSTDEDIGGETSEHVVVRPNDDVLQVNQDGDRVDARNYEYRVLDGVACYVEIVQKDEIPTEALLALGSSDMANNSTSVANARGCSTSLSLECLGSGVQFEGSTLQIQHEEEKLSQIENVEGCAGYSGASEGKNSVVSNEISTLTELEDALQLETGDYVIGNGRNGVCSEDCSATSSSEVKGGGTGNLEDKEYQVVFERKLSFGNRESGPDMDESLWQCLPEDLLDKVLAWLPVASCVHFRSVCRRWCSLMNSERFFQMHSSNSAQETWVLSFGDRSRDLNDGAKRRGQIFDPVRNRTFTLEFPFLREYCVPVATAGGLVCFCCDENNNGENDVSFFVCNPLTKAWESIPSPCSRVSIVTLVADAESGSMGYKLYVFCEASVVRWLWMGVLDHSTKEYDSKLNRWKDVGDVHSGEQFKPGSLFSHGKGSPPFLRDGACS